MYRSKLFIALFISLIFSACSSEFEEEPSLLTCADIKSATGIRFYDANGAAIGTAGLAGQLYHDRVNNSPDFEVFPNPCVDVISLYYDGFESVETVIIPATKYAGCSIDLLYVDDFFTSDIDTAIPNTEASIMGTAGSPSITNFDVSMLDEGFYNIIMSLSDSGLVISRTTIYVNKTRSPDEVIEFLSQGWEE